MGRRHGDRKNCAVKKIPKNLLKRREKVPKRHWVKEMCPPHESSPEAKKKGETLF